VFRYIAGKSNFISRYLLPHHPTLCIVAADGIFNELKKDPRNRHKPFKEIKPHVLGAMVQRIRTLVREGHDVCIDDNKRDILRELPSTLVKTGRSESFCALFSFMHVDT
jgi:hypothetical protein